MEIRPIDEADVKRVLRAVKRNRMVCINRETEIALKVAEGGLTGCKTLSLNTLRDAIYQDAVEHGLWEDADKFAKDCADEGTEEQRKKDELFHRRHQAATLVFFEADELLSAVEEEDFDHTQEELADVIIQAFSTAGYLGIDIDTAIRRKMAINKKRPWKHEGEKK